MLTNRTRTVLMVSMILMLGSLVVLGALLFVISGKQAEVAERGKERATAEAKRVQLSALGTLVSETEEDRAALSSFVLTESSVISFLSLIEDTARAQGLTLDTKSLNVTSLPDNEIFESLSLTTELTGSLDAVSRMLVLLETLPYQVALDAVTIQFIGSNELPDMWSGDITMRVTKMK